MRAPSPADLSRRRRHVEELCAGGLVIDFSDDRHPAALIGKRIGRGRLLWALPKGHLEGEETAQEAAVREIAEETGITGEVLGELGTIRFSFAATQGGRIHKTVRHFLLRATGGELSDADDDVHEVDWVPFDQLTRRLTHVDERRLMYRAERLMSALPDLAAHR